MSFVYQENDRAKENVKPSFSIIGHQKEDDQDPWISHPYRMMALSFATVSIPTWIMTDTLVASFMGISHAATMYFMQWKMHFQSIDKDDIDKVDYNKTVSVINAGIGAMIGFYFTESPAIPIALAVIGAVSPYACEKIDDLFAISKKPKERTVNNASHAATTDNTTDLRKSPPAFGKY
jgi:hypothetical protein